MHLFLHIILLSSISIWLVSTADRDPNKLGVLRASAYHLPPMMEIEMDDKMNMIFKGAAVEVLKILGRSFNAEKIEFVLVNVSAVLKYGYVRVLIQQLIDKEVDIAPYYFSPTVQGTKEMDFFYASSYSTPEVILIAYPEQKNEKLFAIIKPFQLKVWLILLASIAVFHAIKAWSSYWDVRAGSSRLFSLRFVLTAPWYLMCTVLMFSYTSTLVSNLTLTELEPIPNSYEELVNSIHSRPLIVFEDMSVTDRILKATSGAMKKLGDFLRENPKYIRKTIEPKELLEHLLAGGTYIGPKVMVEWLINQDLEQNGGECRFMMSRDLGVTDRLSFGLPKNGPYNEMMNLKSLYLDSFGYVQSYVLTTFVPRIGRCVAQNALYVNLQVLKVRDLYGAFIVLGVGLSISFIVCLLEIFISRLR